MLMLLQDQSWLHLGFYLFKKTDVMKNSCNTQANINTQAVSQAELCIMYA